MYLPVLGMVTFNIFYYRRLKRNYIKNLNKFEFILKMKNGDVNEAEKIFPFGHCEVCRYEDEQCTSDMNLRFLKVWENHVLFNVLRPFRRPCGCWEEHPYKMKKWKEAPEPKPKLKRSKTLLTYDY